MSDTLLHRFTCVISKSFFARGIVRERPTPPAWDGLEPLEPRLLLSALYWDPDGDATCNDIYGGSCLGGSGYWTTDTDEKLWYDPSSSCDIAWPSSGDYEAVFWGDSGTVTLAENITAQSLTFKTSGYTVQSNTLTLSCGSIEVTSGSATVSSVIAGSAGLTKTCSSGTLVLSGVSTYTGTTTIQDGTLELDGGDDRLPTGTTVTLYGTLALNGRNQEVAGLAGSGGVDGGYSCATFTVNTASDFTFTGVLSGSLNLVKTGSCTLTLSGCSSYTGTTAIQGGVLRLDGNDNRLPTGTAVTVSCGTLALNGRNQEVAGLSGSGGVVNGGCSGATLTVTTSCGDFTFAGGLGDGSGTGSLSLTKTGYCTLTLSGNSTYTGATTIQNGTLKLDGCDNRLPTGTTVTMCDNGVLKLNGWNQEVAGLAGSGCVINESGSCVDAALTVNTASSDSTFAGILADSSCSCGGGSLSLIKKGSCTLTLSGGSGYTGTTSIEAGTLRLGGDNALSTSTTVTLSGTLELNGWDQEVAGLTGSGGVNGGCSGAALTVNTTSDFTFTGVLSGSLSLIKTGSSTLTLSGANTYGGGTTIEAGTLRVTTDALPGNVTGSGVLEFDQSFGGEYSGVISGSVSVLVAGGGSVELSSCSSYTGATLIQNGTLSLAGGDNTLSPYTTVTLGDSCSYTTGNLDLNGWDQEVAGLAAAYTSCGNCVCAGSGVTLTVNASGDFTFGGVLSGGLSLAKKGTGTLTLSGANTYSGATEIWAGTLQLSGGDNRLPSGTTVTLGDPNSLIPGALKLHGWNQEVAGLETANSCSDNTVLNGNSTAGTLTVNLVSGELIYAGLLTDGSGGGSLGLTKKGSGTQVLARAQGTTNTYSGLTTILGGALRAALGTALPDASNLVFGAGTCVCSCVCTCGNGVLESWGEFTRGLGTGASQVRWCWGDGGFSAYSADLTVNIGGQEQTPLGLTWGVGGFVPVGSRLLLGSAAADSSVVMENPIDLNYSCSCGATRTIAVAGSSGMAQISGVLSCNGVGLTKAGAGTLILSGANTYGGATTIQAGTLQVTTGTLPGNVTNSGTLVFDQAFEGEYSGVISGSGAVWFTGGGTVKLSGSSSYTGPTTIANGTVRILTNNALPTSTVLTLGDTVSYGNFLPLTGRADRALPASTTFTCEFVGVLELNGHSQEVAGLQTGSSGANRVVNGSSTPATLTVNTVYSDSTFDGVLGGSCSYDNNLGLIKKGSYTLILSGLNTYGGVTTIEAGTLQVTTDTLPGAVTNSGTLVFDQAFGGEYSSVISGSGSVWFTGGGTVQLSGANTYTGSTTVEDGELTLTEGARISSTEPVYLVGAGQITGSGQTVGPVIPVEFDGTTWRPVLSLAAIGAQLYTSGDLMCGGLTRGWSSAGQYTPFNLLGSGWGVFQWPQILQAGTNRYAITAYGESPRWFDYNSTTYEPLWYLQDTLTHSEGEFRLTDGQDTLTQGGGEFVLTDTSGGILRLYDFSSSTPGRFESYTDPAGNVTEATYTDGQLTRVEWSLGDGVTQRLNYTYYASGSAAGLVETATRESYDTGNSETTFIREAAYTYYGDNEDYGSLGDLKTVVIQDDAEPVHTLETKYYRYYKLGDSNGYPHALRYAFEGASYERLAHDAAEQSTTPETADNTFVAPYTDLYLEYDAGRRVTKRVVPVAGSSEGGGLGTYTYVYDTSSGCGCTTNTWRYKTIETLPGEGATRTAYFNAAGEIMLEAFKPASSNSKWCTFHKYDDDGRETLSADPVAVTGYDEQYADLLHAVSGNYQYIDDYAGLITISAYSTTTTASTQTAGEVAGYLHTVSIKNGETDPDPVLQLHVDYIASPEVNGMSIYPVHSTSVYSGTGGSGERTTTYDYTWYAGTFGVDSLEVSLPVVGTPQNGSGTADVTSILYDSFGRPIWTKDAEGYINHVEYDAASGAVTRTIVDVDGDSLPSEEVDYLVEDHDWVLHDSGLHLVTEMEVDPQGRTTKLTDPNGIETYTVYNDVDAETRVYAGWDATNHVPTGPTVVYRDDRAHGYFETLTMWATPDLDGNNEPDGTEVFDIEDIQSLSRSYTNTGGQTVHDDAYFNLTGMTYSAAPDLGTAGANYLRTTYDYGDLGLPARTVDPTGTIRRTVHDALGRDVSEWVGTDDTPTSGAWSPENTAGANMVETDEYVYDGGGVGDGNLTQSTVFADDNTSYVTSYKYDWRNRLTGVRGPDKVASEFEYDNLGEVTAVKTYADANQNFEIDVDTQNHTTELRAQTESDFHDQGRVYRTRTYKVDPKDDDPPTVRLTSNAWYDPRGMVMKTADSNGLFWKVKYDGAGRATATYLSYDSDDTEGGSAYAGAQTVTGDTVIEQTQTIYDAGSRPVASLYFRRLETDTTTDNELTAANSYATASVTWYDKVGRVTHVIDFGHDRDSSADGVDHYIFGADGNLIDTDHNEQIPADGIPDAADAWDNVYQVAKSPVEPNSSDEYIVTQYSYDQPDGGTRYDQVTDNRGIPTRTYRDALGRVTQTVANYDDGVDASDVDTDQTTDYAYDPAGRLWTQTARIPRGTGNGVGGQETWYLYGSDVDRSWVTHAIYPDSSADTSGSSVTLQSLSQTDGVATATTADPHGYNIGDAVQIRGAAQDEYNGWFLITGVDTYSFTYAVDPSATTPATGTITARQLGTDAVLTGYDRLGRAATVTDQRGVEHTYAYDSAGRLQSDAITDLPASVNDTVLRIAWTYDDFSRVSLITSYDAASGGNVLNQVAYAYDAWGNVQTAWQSHSGTAVTTGDEDDQSPHVHYAYDDGAYQSEAAYVRLSSITYPNGRVVYYNYPASGIGARLSRLDNIASSNTPSTTDKYAAYTYLGADTVIEVAHPNVDGGLTLTYGSDGNYPGFDRLGRIAYQTWVKDDDSYVERLGYGYDRNSNVVWRADRTDPLTVGTRDEAYAYDGLNRLTKAVRGMVAGATPRAPGPGDINGDGVVDDTDVDIIDGNYDSGASTNAGWAEGDINGDGLVNDDDVGMMGVLYGMDYTESVSISKTWQWGLDAQGNWTAYSEDAGDGTYWDLDQQRFFNAANEIDTDNVHGSADEGAITETVGPAWVGPAYDAAGNLIEAPMPGSETTRQKYIYDGWNRLVQVTDADDNLVVEFAYDGLDRRISEIVRQVAGETVTYDRTDYYFNEQGQVLEERQATGFEALGAYYPASGARGTVATEVIFQYIWDLAAVDRPVLRDENEDPEVDGDCTEAGDERLFYVTDGGGRTTALVDGATGARVENYMYDPCGKPTIYDPDWTDPVDWDDSAMNAFLLPGKRFDPPTGLYASEGGAVYHPTLGRDLQRSAPPASFDLSDFAPLPPVSSPPRWSTICGGPAPSPDAPNSRIYLLPYLGDPGGGPVNLRAPGGFTEQGQKDLEDWPYKAKSAESGGSLDEQKPKGQGQEGPNAAPLDGESPYDRMAGKSDDKMNNLDAYIRIWFWMAVYNVPTNPHNAALVLILSILGCLGHLPFGRPPGEGGGAPAKPGEGELAPKGGGAKPTGQGAVSSEAGIGQAATRNLAKAKAGIPRSAQPIRQGTYGQGTRWWEYTDSKGNIKIVVEHPDGTVHVGTPKPQSTHGEGGPPKFYPEPGTGHVGQE